MAIPSPTMAHFRGGRAAIDIQNYPDMEQFWVDLAEVYRKEIAALYEAGVGIHFFFSLLLFFFCRVDERCINWVLMFGARDYFTVPVYPIG